MAELKSSSLSRHSCTKWRVDNTSSYPEGTSVLFQQLCGCVRQKRPNLSVAKNSIDVDWVVFANSRVSSQAQVTKEIALNKVKRVQRATTFYLMKLFILFKKAGPLFQLQKISQPLTKSGWQLIICRYWKVIQICWSTRIYLSSVTQVHSNVNIQHSVRSTDLGLVSCFSQSPYLPFNV